MISRTRLAVRATRVVNGASRLFGAGGGSVIGGRVGLALDPALVAHLAAGRSVAAVSGTNGKTTTTALLAAALASGDGSVVTNASGANMPAGYAAALATGPARGSVVLEVDEGYVSSIVSSLSPGAVALLNLSRDQLDRTSEVRMVAGRWRKALEVATGTTVVANADDPLVVWGAGSSRSVLWVAAGLAWHLDAVGCPACGGQVVFDRESAGGWACVCGFRRPSPDIWLEPDGAADDEESATWEAVWTDGRRVPVSLAIPGRFNRANAVVAAAAAEAMGVSAAQALRAMSGLSTVAGRFSVRAVGGVPARLMLAKNPAGWHELLALVCPATSPVVVAINARIADGRDPSWLWDVEFEKLAGRVVVAAGERCRDLSVRLRYAEVDHVVVRDPASAVQAARRAADGHDERPVEFIGNYTAFHDLLRATRAERQVAPR